MRHRLINVKSMILRNCIIRCRTCREQEFALSLDFNQGVPIFLLEIYCCYSCRFLYNHVVLISKKNNFMYSDSVLPLQLQIQYKIAGQMDHCQKLKFEIMQS